MIKIYGHDKEIKALEGHMEAAMSGLLPSDRPGGIFLLMGQTGSGKTETVRYFAEHLHGDKKKLIRLNCAEYRGDHEIARLIGAPPGYVGYQKTPPLITQKKIEAARSKNCPWTIVLFDEIEKASPALFDLLLGVMDRGELQTGGGVTLDFNRCFLFFTGNVGADRYSRGTWKLEESGLNFEYEILAALREEFRPEFLGRIDKILLFNPLSTEDLNRIINKELEEFEARLSLAMKSLGIKVPSVSLEKEALSTIRERANTKTYGGRGIKKVIVTDIIIPISYLLRDGLGSGYIVVDKDLSVRWR